MGTAGLGLWEACARPRAVAVRCGAGDVESARASAPVARHLGCRRRRLPQIVVRHRQLRGLRHQKEAAVAVQRFHPAAAKARLEDLALVAIERTEMVVVARMVLIRFVGSGENAGESLVRQQEEEAGST